jgi:hypothetical protein
MKVRFFRRDILNRQNIPSAPKKKGRSLSVCASIKVPASTPPITQSKEARPWGRVSVCIVIGIKNLPVFN